MIRPWTERDLPAIARLLSELDEALGESTVLDPGRMLRQYRSMGRHPDLYENYVYDDEGVAVGFLSLLFYESVYHRTGTAQVNELVVAKGRRGAGIGSALIGHALERARGRGMDELEVGVMKDNAEALAFYRARGIADEYLLLGVEFGD